MMPSRDLAGARIVAVHAHPDDEAIWTGGLLADAVERGADVTVVTCTLGEQGEVIGETIPAPSSTRVIPPWSSLRMF